MSICTLCKNVVIAVLRTMYIRDKKGVIEINFNVNRVKIIVTMIGIYNKILQLLKLKRKKKCNILNTKKSCSYNSYKTFYCYLAKLFYERTVPKIRIPILS